MLFRPRALILGSGLGLLLGAGVPHLSPPRQEDGVAHVVVMNEAGATVRVEQLRLAGSAMPVLAGATPPDRQEFAFALDAPTEAGEITIRRADGSRETLAVVLDRRPRHCRVGVWIRPDRVEATGCAGFDPREVGAERARDGTWVVR